MPSILNAPPAPPVLTRQKAPVSSMDDFFNDLRAAKAARDVADRRTDAEILAELRANPPSRERVAAGWAHFKRVTAGKHLSPKDWQQMRWYALADRVVREIERHGRSS
jgi:hypothetical protein